MGELHPAGSELSENRKLSLVDCELTDDDLSRLAKLKRIRRLDLSGNPLTDKSNEILKSFAKLEVLRVEGTKISLGKLAKLRVPKLRVLDACGFDGGVLDLTPNGFGGLPNLEVLSMAGCNYIAIKVDPAHPMSRLTHLDVGNGDVELDGLASVLPSIRRVCVDAGQLTAPVCKEFAKASSLDEIGFPPSACSTCFDCESVMLGAATVELNAEEKGEIEEAVNGLMSSRPGLKVTWVRGHPEAPSFGYRCGQRVRGKGFDGKPLPAEYLPPPQLGGGFY